MKNYVKIDGIAEVPETFSADQFTDLLIEFMEANGFTFGGGLTEVDEEGNPV